MRTYIYEVFSDPDSSHFEGYYADIDVSQVRFAWSALEVSPYPDPAQSYFVPQGGTFSSPDEGSAAIKFFRVCPNNDNAHGSLPDAVRPRIKIVLKDSLGNPIAGVPANQIYILLNGGSAAQGFVGDGADSIISNAVWNSSPACPNLQVIYADSATGASGSTTLTFAGNAVYPDHSRRWGHYDSEIPVYAWGTRLAGRRRTTSPDSAYALQIKNMDVTGGLGTFANSGETVTISDFNSVSNHVGEPDSQYPENFWRDLDSSGDVSQTDANLIFYHIGDDCDTPNGP